MSLTAAWQQGWDPDQSAIMTPRASLDYRTLRHRMHRAIGLLTSAGVGRGDVVALMMDKEPAMVELVLAALACGAIVLPLNSRYTKREARFALDDSAAVWAVLPDALAEALSSGRTVVAATAVRSAIDHAAEAAPPPSPPDDAPALLMYTSGTTGQPKGALHTRSSLAAMIESLHAAWQWSARDRLLHALPINHVHGLVVAQLGALRAGATAVWVDTFQAGSIAARLERGDITVFMGVPTFYVRLLGLPALGRSPGVRLFTSGSAPLPAAVHDAFAARTGHAIVERYGMTEIGIVCSNPLGGPRRAGSIGRPLPGVEARIAGEPGQLLIRGPSLFREYLGNPAATAAALAGGWMHTGDLGAIDEDGYVWLSGRASDLILCGGLNVYPREVEAVLAACAGVTEVAVIGVPDADLGEVPIAVVTGDAAAETLRESARGQLAPYKVPRRFIRVDALPRNAMGKVVKATLRAWYGGFADGREP